MLEGSHSGGDSASGQKAFPAEAWPGALGVIREPPAGTADGHCPGAPRCFSPRALDRVPGSAASARAAGLDPGFTRGTAGAASAHRG